jgi:pimeloyl-ACP methyl ester carboxylesterase
MKSRINGINLAYDALGEMGLPVVLIHGFGLNRGIWRVMVENYLADYRVILPDVRGHGESDAPEGAYSMAVLADDLAGLLDHLDVDKAVVCGHSMGGYIALAFAAQYPERLAGLGLITSRAEADSAEKKEGRLGLVEAVQKQGSTALAEILAPRLSHDPAVVKAAYDLIAATPPAGIIGAALGMAERPNRTALFDRLEVPTLVVAGVEDQIVPLDDARQLANGLEKGMLVEIPGTGHAAMLEQPQRLANALVDFLGLC